MGRVIILALVFFLAISPPFSTSQGAIIYVARDGSGDYNCDGENDHIEINLALAAAAATAQHDTVYLKSGVYNIKDTIIIGTRTTLTGDSTAVIRLADNANWPRFVPMIKNASPGDRDLEICGFEVDGNDINNSDPDEAAGRNRYRGSNWYNMIHITGAVNVRIHHMYMHHNLNDGFIPHTCDSVYFHDNRIIQTGHDALYGKKSTNLWAYNNVIRCRTNSGLRIWQCNNVKLFNNTVWSQGEGGSGIQVQKDAGEFPMNDIEIYGNTVYTTVHSGISLFTTGSYPLSDAYVHIHHNKIYATGSAGISTSGFNLLVENNILDGCRGSGIRLRHSYSAGSPTGTGFEIRLRNNIICNIPEGAFAVLNLRPNEESVIMENNCLFNNPGGNYQGENITYTDNIYTDPLFADPEARDYHLKSTTGRWNGTEWVLDAEHSPCIDAGYTGSDFSKEPVPNGGRINIGPYGNTPEASKSR